ncbi:MAG TPA: sensor histidine kinase KdpD [Oligoflexia bacterium]|nr:sensor histidine kinase KdpD [Oligoflexia bacterium]HMR24316.1 sensor histidine kinase KdpD [Oligoflexia bacterium]
MTIERPRPDDLLKAVQREERLSKTGKLRVFFGMAAGVGKTFAMLKAAHEKQKDGTDVVIGVIHTHGRPETEALLIGLPILPLKRLRYRGVEMEELDLDAILSRKPQLVLIDELAHTNVSGSRHEKRWQDITDILDAGIDVYTTLNVQHLESRKEIVESITGITIRETVPDVFLEKASQIELVDLSPETLLKRLKEGKVYFADKIAQASKHFFRLENLAALREMALRFTAEKVDYDLLNLRTTTAQFAAWRTTERLMVAVSFSPHSEPLIRATRRLAFSQEASWIAVYVDTGRSLNEEDRETLKKNIALARELGAEVITLRDPDLPKALIEIARRRNVTQIVMGRPVRHWFERFIRGASLLDRLVKESGDIDIHIIRQRIQVTRKFKFRSFIESETQAWDYVTSFWIVIAVSVVTALVKPWIGYQATGFIFLLGVLGTGLKYTHGPVIFSAFLSALVWDFFFIPPFGTLYIREPEDIFMCVLLFVSAMVTGFFMSRIRKTERMLRRREEVTASLYRIARDAASEPSHAFYLPLVSQSIGELLDGTCSFFIKNSKGQLTPFNKVSKNIQLNPKEFAVAQWTFDHNQPAGWSTSTLSGSKSLYVPMKGPQEMIGVLVFMPASTKFLLLEEENFLHAVARQLAVSIERETFEEQARRTQKLEESELLYQTILNTVSHEVKTPLTTLVGSVEALRNKKTSSTKEKQERLMDDLEEASGRLTRVVENLLNMSRLSAGQLSLRIDTQDPNDLVRSAIKREKKALSHHQLHLQLDESIPMVDIDYGLMEHAFENILQNAITYSPKGTKITVSTRSEENKVIICVSDEGPGIPEEHIDHIFDKFFRIPGSIPGGTGLGLSVVKGIVNANGGYVHIHNRLEGGISVQMVLPAHEILEQQVEVS